MIRLLIVEVRSKRICLNKVLKSLNYDVVVTNVNFFDLVTNRFQLMNLKIDFIRDGHGMRREKYHRYR